MAKAFMLGRLIRVGGGVGLWLVSNLGSGLIVAWLGCHGCLNCEQRIADPLLLVIVIFISRISVIKSFVPFWSIA